MRKSLLQIIWEFEPTIFLMEKTINFFETYFFLAIFYGQSFIKTVRDPFACGKNT